MYLSTLLLGSFCLCAATHVAVFFAVNGGSRRVFQAAVVSEDEAILDEQDGQKKAACVCVCVRVYVFKRREASQESFYYRCD